MPRPYLHRFRRAGGATLLTVALAATACDHGSPFHAVTPTGLGPLSDTMPRRLTFYVGTDRTPTVAGNVLIFSRQSDKEPGEYAPEGREQCIAFMPLEGGTIQRSLCPDRLIPQPDSNVDTWFEPSLSPDGRYLAFMWQRAARVSALSYRDTYLMVTPVDQPQDTTGVRHFVDWIRPDTPNVQHADIATRISWLDGTRLRFLATREHMSKVKGGGAERVTDTTYDAYALMDLNLTTRAASLVPGGDSVIAYAPAAGGGVWIVKSADSAALEHLDPATGIRTPVGRFGSAVLDLINVDGSPVAAVRAGAAIERLDVASGSLLEILGFPGPVVRLAAAGGRRFVVEVEQGVRLFGMPTDLYLLSLP